MASDVRALEGMAQTRTLKADADAVKRVRALEMLAEGFTMSEVGRILGRDRRVVRRWKEEASGGL